MTTAVGNAASRQPTSRRQEILDLFEALPRRTSSEILGVAPHADAEAVRAAYRTLAKRFHPDALCAAEADVRDKAQAVFIRITDAYETVLGDAPKAGARPAAPRQAPPAALPSPPVRPNPRAATPPEPPRPPASSSVSRGQRVLDAIDEAQACMSRGDHDAAVEVLHEVVRLADQGQRGRVRLLLAAAYVADPKKRRYALALLSEIVREEPSNAEALALLGTLYFREGLLARAESTLARAVTADPGHLQARAALRSVRGAVHQRSETKQPQPSWGGLIARLLSMAS
jgi:tetratricopeptide (TPR) repeat protein